MQDQSVTVWSALNPRFLTAAPDTAQVLPNLPAQGFIPEAAFLGSDNSHHTAPWSDMCREACEEAGIAEILIKENLSDVSI